MEAGGLVYALERTRYLRRALTGLTEKPRCAALVPPLYFLYPTGCASILEILLFSRLPVVLLAALMHEECM